MAFHRMVVETFQSVVDQPTDTLGTPLAWIKITLPTKNIKIQQHVCKNVGLNTFEVEEEVEEKLKRCNPSLQKCHFHSVLKRQDFVCFPT